MENKIANIIMAIWAVLAIVAFVVAFFVTPLVAKIIFLVFGALNLMIIGSWVFSFIQDIKARRKE